MVSWYKKAQEGIPFTTFDPQIPQDFQMSVYRALHNQAGAGDWELMDAYVTSQNLDVVLSWVTRLLRANGEDDMTIEKAKKWWRAELEKAPDAPPNDPLEGTN